MSRPRITVDLIAEASAGVSGRRAMAAKYDGECGWCGQAILAGDPILWLPNDQAAICGPCAIDAKDNEP